MGDKFLVEVNGEIRYRFQSFKQRIDAVDINVTRRVIRYLDEPDVQGSYFQEALQSWQELNCTTHFTLFTRAVRPLCGSLPQLLFHKKAVVELLVKYIADADQLSIAPLLDLVSVLSRDLMEEILPYYETLLQAIIPKVQQEHVETIEACFNTITFLFKYLLKHLLDDLRPTFRLVLPLLGGLRQQQRTHNRRFAAESFAFLLRKCNRIQLNIIVPYILETYCESPTIGFTHGVSMLFYEAVKSSGQRLHSKTRLILKALVNQLVYESTKLTTENWTQCPLLRLLVLVFKLVALNFSPTDLECLWSVLLGALDETKAQVRDEFTVAHACQAAQLLTLVVTTATVRKGEQIADHKALLDTVHQWSALVTPKDSGQAISPPRVIVRREVLRLGISTLLSAPLPVTMTSGFEFLKHMFKHQPPSVVLPLVLDLASHHWEPFAKLVFPLLVPYTEEHHRLAFDDLLWCWSRLLTLDHIATVLPTKGSSLVTRDHRRIVAAPVAGFTKQLLGVIARTPDWKTLGHALTEPEQTVVGVQIDCALALLPHFVVPADQVAKHLSQLISALTKYLLEPVGDDSNGSDAQFTLQCLLGRLLDHMAALGQREPIPAVVQLLDQQWNPIVLTALPALRLCPLFLQAVHRYLECLHAHSSRRAAMFATANLEILMPQLYPNLGSFQHAVRSPTLAILAIFDQIMVDPPKADLASQSIRDKGTEAQPCPLLAMAHAAEDVPLTFEDHREKFRQLRRILELYQWRRIPRLYLPVFPRLCLAYLSANFKPLWAEAQEIIKQLIRLYPDLVWGIVFANLQRFEGFGSPLAEPKLATGVLASAQALLVSSSENDVQVATPFKLIQGQAECSFLNEFFAVDGCHWEQFNYSQLAHTRYAHHFAMAVQYEAEVTNYRTFFEQLTSVIRAAPFMAEQYFKDLYPLFLSLVQTRYPQLLAPMLPFSLSGNATAQDSAQQHLALTQFVDQAIGSLSTQRYALPTKAPNPAALLGLYLDLFMLMKKNSTYEQAPLLSLVFQQMLTQGMAGIRGKALRCVLLWETPRLGPAVSQVEALVGNKRIHERINSRMSDEPLDLTTASGASSVLTHSLFAEVDAAIALPLLVRNLTGQVLQEMQSRFGTRHGRRHASEIIRALSALGPRVFQYALDLMLEPYASVILDRTRLPGSRGVNGQGLPVTVNDQGEFTVDPQVRLDRAFSSNFHLKYLHLLTLLVDQTQTKALVLAPQILVVVLYILHGLESAHLPLASDDPLAQTSMDATDQDRDANDNGAASSESDDEATPSPPQATLVGDEVAADALPHGDADHLPRTVFDEEDQDDQPDQAVLPNWKQQKMHTLIFDTLRSVFTLDGILDATPFLPHLYHAVVVPRLQKSLRKTDPRELSLALTMLNAWSSQPLYFPCLVQMDADANAQTLASGHDPDVSLLGRVTELLLPARTRSLVAKDVFGILSNVIELAYPQTAKRNADGNGDGAGDSGMSSEESDDDGTPSSRTRTVPLGKPNADTVMDEDPPVGHAIAQQLLHTSLTTIVSHLTRMINILTRPGKRAPPSAPSSLHISVIKALGWIARVAPRITDRACAQSVLHVVLPLVKRRNFPESMKRRVLRMFIRLLPLVQVDIQDGLASPRFREYYKFVCRMFASLEKKGSRLSAIPLFQQLVAVIRTNQETASASTAKMTTTMVDQLVIDLNALNEEGDTITINNSQRLTVMMHIYEELYHQLAPFEWQAVICNLVYFLRALTNSVWRSNAALGLIRFVEQAGQSHARATTAAPSPSSEALETDRAMAHLVLVEVYQPLIADFKSASLQTCRDWLPVLAAIVQHCPHVAHLGGLRSLLAVHGDSERNVFTNLFHERWQYQTQALDDLAAVCRRQPAGLTEAHIETIFLPLVQRLTGNSSAQKSEVTPEAFHVKVVSRAIESTLPAIMAGLPWASTHQLLRTHIGQLRKTSAGNERPARVIASLLEHLKVDMCLWQKESKSLAGPTTASSAQVQLSDPNNPTPPSELARQQAEAQLSKTVHDAVLYHIFPDIIRYVRGRDDETEGNRISLIFPMIRLLHRLPSQAFRKNGPALLAVLCRAMKSPQPKVRDEVRQVLIKTMQLLGPEYLEYVISQLQTFLIRGYQRHVLTYTVYVVIKYTVAATAHRHGNFDGCLDRAVQLFTEEVFGTLAEEKKVVDIVNKTPEARQAKGSQGFRLLASCTSFRHLGKLLVPLKGLMSESNDATVMRTVNQVLSQVAKGIVANPRATLQDVLVFSHGLITRNLSLTTEVKATKNNKVIMGGGKTKWRVLTPAREDDVYTVYATREQARQESTHFKNNVHRFIEFGMSLLLRTLRSSSVEPEDEDEMDSGPSPTCDKSNPHHLALLDPFVDVVGNCLYSNFQKILSQALEIMGYLYELPLPAVKPTVQLLVDRTFELLQMTGSTHSRVVPSCFRLLTLLLQKYADATTVTEPQLLYVLNLILPDIDDNEVPDTTFAILQAIIGRRFVVTEMYQVMERVARRMVTHHDKRVRQRCREVYFQFLLEYPQSQHRLNNQVQFLVQNLKFEFQTGRESVLEMLNTMATELSDEVLDPYIDLLYMALMTVLVNDRSKECRAMAAHLIQRLFLRMSSQQLDRVAMVLNRLCRNARPVLHRVAKEHQGLLEYLMAVSTTIEDSLLAAAGENGEGGTSAATVDASELTVNEFGVPLTISEAQTLHLNRAALQIYGLVVEAKGTASRSFTNPAMDHALHGLLLSRVLWQATEQRVQEKTTAFSITTEDNDDATHGPADIDATGDSEQTAARCDWRTSYMALTMLSKLFEQFPTLMYGKTTKTQRAQPPSSQQPQLDQLWHVVVAHLRFPHAWVRLAASRLLGLYFANVPSVTATSHNADSQLPLLSTAALRSIADGHLAQIISPHLTADLSHQIVKNLYFVGKYFYQHQVSYDRSQDASTTADDSMIDQADPNEGLAGDHCSRALPAPFADLVPRSMALQRLFRRFGNTAVRLATRPDRFATDSTSTVHAQTAALQWCAAMLTCMESADLNPYLVDVLYPIHALLTHVMANTNDEEFSAHARFADHAPGQEGKPKLKVHHRPKGKRKGSVIVPINYSDEAESDSDDEAHNQKKNEQRSRDRETVRQLALEVQEFLKSKVQRPSDYYAAFEYLEQRVMRRDQQHREKKRRRREMSKVDMPAMDLPTPEATGPTITPSEWAEEDGADGSGTAKRLKA
ncbi:U3 snoRNP protein [Dimargaris verticillata]|uniref:U3 snoRNP protein n=1 Tax=Dimargaris verticillata TaxID=2761393 RepID=A0A9W8BA24_9FUNG|nr:U3 snoRNP protein [Dimargaris verticillata]